MSRVVCGVIYAQLNTRVQMEAIALDGE